MSWIGIDSAPAGLNWVVPLGLSFYTFQAIGYLCDVYDNKISCEKNWWDYMLFVSFFPQILCEPISKASDLLPQIKAKHRFNYPQAVDGCKYLLWGMALKVCIADRLGIYVDSIYGDYNIHSSGTLMLASIAYSFQIYTDFAGYSFMALGTGKLLGYDLIANFNRPYLATSVSEFWKKWNISLTQWLTAHIYIPLGGNRKGKLRTYVNIIITFLVSGIWHGANWTFIFWGIIHGIAQCFEKIFGWNKAAQGTLKVIFKTFLTFLIVNFAWIYFRMPSITEGNGVIARIFSLKGNGVELPTEENLIGVLAAIIILLIFDFAPHRESPLPKLFTNSSLAKRRIAYVNVMLAILIFGVFENGAFIYIQF